jgi:hypothetical protein
LLAPDGLRRARRKTTTGLRPARDWLSRWFRLQRSRLRHWATLEQSRFCNRRSLFAWLGEFLLYVVWCNLILTPLRFAASTLACSILLWAWLRRYLPISALECFSLLEDKWAAVCISVLVVTFVSTLLLGLLVIISLVGLSRHIPAASIAANYQPQLLTAIMAGLFALILAPAWSVAERVQFPTTELVYVFCIGFVFLYAKREHDRATWGDVATPAWGRFRSFLRLFSLSVGYVLFPGALLAAFMAPSYRSYFGDASTCAYVLKWNPLATELSFDGPYNETLWRPASPAGRCGIEESAPDEPTPLYTSLYTPGSVPCEKVSSFRFFGVLPIPSYLRLVREPPLLGIADLRLDLLFPLHILYVWTPLALAIGAVGKGLTDRLLGGKDIR